MSERELGRLPKPEWLMLGVPHPRGVRLYASKDLPQADFDQAVIGYETVWELGAQMRNMLVIDKPTYPEAIARLFEIWNSQQQREVGAGGEYAREPPILIGPKQVGTPYRYQIGSSGSEP